MKQNLRGKWNSNDLIKAIEDVKAGMSKREASRNYSIPLSTLRDRIKSDIKNDPSLGCKTVLSQEQEKLLVQRLLYLANIFYGITPLELRRIVYTFATENKLRHRFNTATKLAGKDWYYGFVRRHPEICLRKPEPTSINRIAGFNREAMKKFYDNLEFVYDEYELRSHDIYNVDETGFNVVQKTSKIVAQRGQKQVGKAVSCERGRNITGIFAMSAAGTYIPPLIIFPRQRMNDSLSKDGPPGAIYACSKNGWSNDELFLKWLEHFATYANCSKEKVTLLVLDNHSSHIGLAVAHFCTSKGIIMVTIPPHTSHRTQPLDVTFFGPLKTAFSREIELLMKTSQAKRVSEYDVAALINRAYMKTATMEKGQKGFKVTGIYPYNPDTFTDEDYLSSEAMISTSKDTSNSLEPEGDENINPDTLERPEERKRTIVDLASPPPPLRPLHDVKQKRKTRMASVILGLNPEQEIISLTPAELSQVRYFNVNILTLLFV